MIKRVTKERVVEYTENDIICDLCETTVAPGTPMITLTPQIAEADGNRFSGDHKLEVCSVECLTKNVGAAGLVFNTNVFPELRTKKRAKDSARDAQTGSINDYAKEMYKQFGSSQLDNSKWGKITSGNTYTDAVAKPYTKVPSNLSKDLDSF